MDHLEAEYAGLVKRADRRQEHLRAARQSMRKRRDACVEQEMRGTSSGAMGNTAAADNAGLEGTMPAMPSRPLRYAGDLPRLKPMYIPTLKERIALKAMGPSRKHRRMPHGSGVEGVAVEDLPKLTPPPEEPKPVKKPERPKIITRWEHELWVAAANAYTLQFDRTAEFLMLRAAIAHEFPLRRQNVKSNQATPAASAAPALGPTLADGGAPRSGVQFPQIMDTPERRTATAANLAATSKDAGISPVRRTSAEKTPADLAKTPRVSETAAPVTRTSAEKTPADVAPVTRTSTEKTPDLANAPVSDPAPVTRTSVEKTADLAKSPRVSDAAPVTRTSTEKTPDVANAPVTEPSAEKTPEDAPVKRTSPEQTPDLAGQHE